MTTTRRNHEHAANADHYGADDLAPFPGATWHYSDAADQPAAPTPTRGNLQPYLSKVPGELVPGEIVCAHGMLCLVTDAPILSRGHAGGRTYWAKALVINRDAVSRDAVPHSFTSPRLSNGYADQAAIARGEHHWTLQGNDRARVTVLVHGPQLAR